MASAALRLLQQIVEDDMHADEHAHEHADEHLEEVFGDAHDEHGENTQNLRIAAIFIVMSAGLLGGIPPLLMKTFRDQGSIVRLLLRALAAGIIIALALIHIIPEAVEPMHSLTESFKRPYPHLGGAVVAFGVIVMVVAEGVTHALLENNLAHKSNNHNHSQDEENGSKKMDVVKQVSSSGPLDVSTDDEEHHHHHHLPLAAAHTGTLREQVMAYMFELGCIFHSVIIGITLGVMTGSKSDVVAMLIALAFHQLLEGIALSSFIIDAAVGMVKGVIMIVIYALTSPVGIAIGIGITKTYDENSVKAKAVQGVFNGLSGGMLLYIGLVQLIAEDFQRKALMARAPKLWVRISCYLALIFGVAAMAILGIWEAGGHEDGHTEGVAGEEDAHVHH
mmetsp:Transcript_11698/g.28715  ORF Transcript_11698/g.28715 Transcript_11698/m.28715 type:complete len:392 (-) Transcript_11698:1177-2352(-)